MRRGTDLLSIEELVEIEEKVREVLNEQLEAKLIKLNRSDKLTEFLQLLEMDELLGQTGFYCNPNGKIIVIGACEVGKDKLIGIAKDLGLAKERFEFYLEYDDGKAFNFKKAQWSDIYSAILVGQMPHSGTAKEEYSSVITALENEPGYPPVVRLGESRMKISKSSFRAGLEYLIQEILIK